MLEKVGIRCLWWSCFLPNHKSTDIFIGRTCHWPLLTARGLIWFCVKGCACGLYNINNHKIKTLTCGISWQWRSFEKTDAASLQIVRVLALYIHLIKTYIQTITVNSCAYPKFRSRFRPIIMRGKAKSFDGSAVLSLAAKAAGNILIVGEKLRLVPLLSNSKFLTQMIFLKFKYILEV